MREPASSLWHIVRDGQKVMYHIITVVIFCVHQLFVSARKLIWLLRPGYHKPYFHSYYAVYIIQPYRHHAFLDTNTEHLKTGLPVTQNLLLFFILC